MPKLQTTKFEAAVPLRVVRRTFLFGVESLGLGQGPMPCLALSSSPGEGLGIGHGQGFGNGHGSVTWCGGIEGNGGGW